MKTEKGFDSNLPPSDGGSHSQSISKYKWREIPQKRNNSKSLNKSSGTPKTPDSKPLVEKNYNESRTDKGKPKKPKVYLTPSFIESSEESDSEPEIIKKYGTSSRPRLEPLNQQDNVETIRKNVTVKRKEGKKKKKDGNKKKEGCKAKTNTEIKDKEVKIGEQDKKVDGNQELIYNIREYLPDCFDNCCKSFYAIHVFLKLKPSIFYTCV